MSLERNESEVVRENTGFSFSMRVVGSSQNVRVWVYDDVLDGKGAALDGEPPREAFEFDRQAFEELASHRHTHGRVAATGQIEISFSDLAGMLD